MKDSVIAKLANQAADFYGDAFKQCHCKDSVPKVWTHTHTGAGAGVCFLAGLGGVLPIVLSQPELSPSD